MNDTLRVVETTEEGRSGQIAARSNWLRAGVINYLATREDADRVLDTLVEAASDDPGG